MLVVGLMMFMVGLFSLVSNRKHVLNMLLSLELIVVSFLWSLVMWMNLMWGEYYFMLFFLTMVVCEGSLGVGLIVMLIRAYGSDLLLGLSLTQC